MSQVPSAPLNNVTLKLDDNAASFLSTFPVVPVPPTIASGTYKPTNYSLNGFRDVYPTPIRQHRQGHHKGLTVRLFLFLIKLTPTALGNCMQLMPTKRIVTLPMLLIQEILPVGV
jgi:hypothetical protein